MTFRALLGIALAIVFENASLIPAWAADKDKLKILFITLEDLRAKLNCYGTKLEWDPFLCLNFHHK